MKKFWFIFKNVWKFIVLVFLILLSFSYAMFQGGFVSWFLFYSFMPFALYCLAISVYSFNGLELNRSLSKWNYNAGEPMEVIVTVRRNFPFPLFFLVVEDQLGESLKHLPQQKTLLFPGFKKEFSFVYTIAELPRGEHFFRSFKLRIGDPLGLIEKEKTFINEEKIMVYPVYTEIIYRPFENHYEQGMIASMERVQRDTSMAIGVREYQPGDRFSWVNWKATAKRNEIMTKEFEQRQSQDMFIIMDCIPGLHFESTVSFTASIIRAVLKKGAQTGFLTISKERVFFPIKGGEKQLQQLFYHLAKIQSKSRVSLDKILEVEQFCLQTVSLMIITEQLTRELIERASFLGQKKGAVSVFLIKGEKEFLTQVELSLIAAASDRGLRVVPIHEGHYAAAFSEVNLR